jgi:hypothetical protein
MQQKRCAIAIGVDKAGKLPLLNAAAKGAKAFADWAQAQGFDTTLLTDADGQTVSASDVRKAVRKYVDSKTYSQLIVFFSGHGILKGPNDECWLLSEMDVDPNEAILVGPSKSLAYNAGIPHVTFISDACRSAANNLALSLITGSTIFPIAQPGQQLPDIDMFYATRPGDPAWEVRDGQDAANNYKGIFTDCLLQGLTGKVEEVISDLPLQNEQLPVVFPYELKKYLEKQVPLAAEAIRITLQQYPMIEVTSRPPVYLSQVGPPKRLTRGGIPKGHSASPPLTDDIEPITLPINLLLNPTGLQAMDNDIDAAMEQLVTAGGRESFETQTGFSITGAQGFDVLLNSGGHDVFEENGVPHIRIHPQKNTHTLLLTLSNGTATPVAVLPGFIGHILVEGERVMNVNYVPSRNNNRYDEYMIRNEEVAQRRAAAALAARHGNFRIKGDIYGIMGTASYLRNDKALDPSLGMYAAYAYTQAGQHKHVLSVFNYMKKEPEPVLFDVKLLATMYNGDADNLQTPHAPFCPMLAQGWSYLPLHEALLNQPLRQLMQQVIPGLWTTFTPAGAELAQQLIKNKAI